MIVTQKWIAGIAVFAALTTLGAPAVAASKNNDAAASADETFLALRSVSLRDDAAKAAEYAAQLTDYEIPSYVDYYRLKPRLKEASNAEVRKFLQRYEGSAIADRMRNDWMVELGAKGDWVTFEEQYAQFVLDDSTQLKCYALMLQARKGAKVADAARALLHSPKEYGDGCMVLIAALVQSGQFNNDDVWAQIRLAAEANLSGVARRIAAAANLSEKQVVNAIERPGLILASGPGKGSDAHQLYIVALVRGARGDLGQAVQELTRAERQLSASEQALAWAQVALQASLQLAPQTLNDYWRKAAGAPLSDEGYQWRVRMALRAGDWKQVQAGIDAMPVALRDEPAWVYWRARALQVSGKKEVAQNLFASIADQHHFYGQLAAEELGRKISIPLSAQPLTDAEIAPMASNAGFRRAFKFFDMNLRFEGVREWNWELRKMDQRQYLAAAEFARQNKVLDRMVSTSDRTTSEHDFSQRFPSPFQELTYKSTQALGLDMAWVYGLIRQESRFIMNARSHVGASGLMQLMPATARYVAKKIGMDDYHHGRVNDIDTNIQLGTNYLNIVSKSLGGSQALATAAYNAGPGRPRAWRLTLPGTVEGAIFAESIPFTETRGYVKNVLSNATYYAALFDGAPQSLKARLGVVTQRDNDAGE